MTDTTCAVFHPDAEPNKAVATWEGPDAIRISEVAGNLTFLDSEQFAEVAALVARFIDDM